MNNVLDFVLSQHEDLQVTFIMHLGHSYLNTEYERFELFLDK